jgi:GT2 family glycosyltransferase
MSAPTISVVVPTYNRRERLHRVLTGLRDQTGTDSFEVVVVSDGSTDGTDEYLASGAAPLPVVAATQENQGPAAARNRGVELASGDLIVFLDDDVVPDPGLVAAHRDAHGRLGDDVVVIGPMLNPPDHDMSPWIEWEQSMLAKQYKAMLRGDWEATARQFYTGNASLRREHFLAVGGFDTAFRRAEDVEMAYRLDDRGLKWAFEPDAVGLHYAERSFDAWRDTGYAYGRNDIVFARDCGRRYVYAWIIDDYRSRPLPMRQLLRLCVPRRRLADAVGGGLRRLAELSTRIGLSSVTRFSLSGIYAIAYCQGVVVELGHPDALWALVGNHRSAV